jgi:hypothetical protein
MRITPLVMGLFVATCSHAVAQSSSGGAIGSSAGADLAAGSTLSNGNTISGTGDSPGPNTSNALSRGTTGSKMGTPAHDS